jgi:hypothetical protein
VLARRPRSGVARRQTNVDPRTIALLLVVPASSLSLLRRVLANQRANFDHIGAPVLAVLPFVVMVPLP